jgi:GT2 family glycosyltransferase
MNIVAQPCISFVVPVRNDATRLEVCLRSIRAAHPTSGEVEIVVVDNGSTDRSPDVARAFGARVLVIENVRVSELRNRGAQQAEGPVLAFVDADNEIVPGWAAAALENLQDASVGATGALYDAPPRGTWVQRGYGLLRGRTRATADVEWLGSGNLAVRRQAFQAVRGFDTTLEACEDVDLCHRLQATGVRILGDPRLGSVHHGDPKTLRDLFKSELWRGRDNLRVSFRRPIVWTAIPSAMIPVADAAMLAAAVAGLFAWGAAWTPGLVVALMALILLALGAFAKVVRAATRTPGVGVSGLVQGFVVASVYDVARALALVARAPHRNARARATVPAS